MTRHHKLLLDKQRSLIRPSIVFAMFVSAYTGVLAQEYTYDANGNLKTDNNKQISSIHYNYLNLVDTIIYADARKMVYTYTSKGQKLREQSINADGTILIKRDYDHQFLYTGNALQEIQHEEGRLVPVTPGSSSTSFDYQYHLNDHLGNVRSMLTSNPGTTSNIAVFETSSVNGEQNNFTDYDKARRINSILFDHTKAGTTHYSQRLNGSVNEKYGIAKSLSVMPGDTVKLEVYAKYVDPDKNNLTAALTAMLSQIAMGTASGGTVIDGAGYAGSGNTPFPFTGLNDASESGGSGPKAYLNWLVFDHNFVFKTGGHVRMSEAGKENGSNVKHEKLEKQLVITQPGYVYVYLSNEETTPVDVYFDDLSVTQANGPVIQQTDYDPFGLTFNEYARENAAPNNFLYNGKELQKDFDLNWYDYGARMYDAALGRWHTIDPMAEKYNNWSPYNYVMNNPLKFIDPDGNDLKNFDSGEDASNPPQRTIENGQRIPTGKKIIDATKNNRKVLVYASFYRSDNPNAPYGRTISITPDGPVSVVTDKSSHKSTLQVDPEFKRTTLKKFNGLDVTDAVARNQRIYIVLVNLGKGNEYNAAEAFLHEIGAHVNGDMDESNNVNVNLATALLKPVGLTTADIEHIVYGQAEHTKFDEKKGTRTRGNTLPGSLADKVANELAELARLRAEKTKQGRE